MSLASLYSKDAVQTEERQFVKKIEQDDHDVSRTESAWETLLALRNTIWGSGTRRAGEES